MENGFETARKKWRILGPGGGGAQFIPTFSPHNPEIMLVACDMTGAYITKDGGKSWREFNLRERVSSFAFDPIDPEVIYAGSSGLFRSADGGEKWRLIYPDPLSVAEEQVLGDEADHALVSGDNWPGGEIQAIVIDPVGRGHLYIGIYRDRRLTVHYSGNNGKSWEEIYATAGNRLHALYPDPQSSGDNRRLFLFYDSGISVIAVKKPAEEKIKLPSRIKSVFHAACGINPGTGQPLFYITAQMMGENEIRPTEIWKSEDKGETWQQLDVELEGSPAGPETGLVPEYTLLAVSEMDAVNIYAGVGGYLYSNTGGYPEIPEPTGAGSVVSYFGVIKSSNGGGSWGWVLKSDHSMPPANLTTGWAERDYDLPWFSYGPKGIGPIGLKVNPVNPDICCTTDLSSTFLTVDGGVSWKQLYSNDHAGGSVSSRGIDVTTCYGIHFDPFDREHLAVSYTDIGMFHSKDGGNTWLHAIEGVPPAWGNTCYWLEFDPEVEGRVWSVWGGAHDLPRRKMFKTGSFHLAQGGVCRSENGMAEWRKSNTGMPGNSVATHIVLDTSSPVGKRTLYTAVFDKGVYKSMDDGFSWELKNSGIQGNLNAWRIVRLPDGTLFLLVARGLRNRKVVGGALYKSSDGAGHWERLPLPEGVNAPNDLAFDPCDPRRMYLACWPDKNSEATAFGGLYATDDGGYNWQGIFDPWAYVYGVAVHPEEPSTLFIATFNGGVCRSEDRGGTWSRLKGYNFKWGHRPFVDPRNKEMLYITTFGSSLWYGPAIGDTDAFEDVYPFEALE